MNNSKKSYSPLFRRIYISFILLLAILISTVIPVLANEAPAMEISPWAIPDLNEGEKYGIYPIDWYYNEFLDVISQDKLDKLLEKTTKKLDFLNLEKNEMFKAMDYTKDGTRESVLISYYNLLNQYKVSDSLNINQGTPIEYLNKRGIVLGVGNDLQLERECTVEQAVIFATRLIADTYEAHDRGGKGFAWKVEKEGNTLYLLGSIHAGDSNLYPINKNLKAAFEESDILLVEANLINQDGLDEFIQGSMYSDGTSLKDYISEDTFDKTMKVLSDYGLPTETYSQIKPWRIANDLSLITISDLNSMEGAQETASLGVDLYFTLAAMVTGKPIGELEGLKFQADLFNSLPLKIQEEYLNGILDNILNPETTQNSEDKDYLKLWLEQWINGDVEGFTNTYSSLMSNEEDEFSKMLFGKRDEEMVVKLSTLLEKEGENTYFVVVGSGHLVLENMVIDKLRNKGYKVESLY